MKTIVHINQHIIKANRKKNERKPVITVKTYKSNRYAHEVDILDKDGNVVATIKYSPDKPLSCGAHVWLETENKVKVRKHATKNNPVSSGSRSVNCVEGDR